MSEPTQRPIKVQQPADTWPMECGTGSHLPPPPDPNPHPQEPPMNSTPELTFATGTRSAPTLQVPTRQPDDPPDRAGPEGQDPTDDYAERKQALLQAHHQAAQARAQATRTP